MLKFFDLVDRGALWLSVIALLFITTMTCISVIGRYFFNAPVPDDLVMSEFTMVIVAFLPLAAVQAAREHVFVTIFSDWLPNRPKVAMELFGVYLGAITFTIVTCAVYTDFKQAFDVGAYEEGALEIPEAPFRFIVFLAYFYFQSVFILTRLFRPRVSLLVRRKRQCLKKIVRLKSNLSKRG